MCSGPVTAAWRRQAYCVGRCYGMEGTRLGGRGTGAKRGDRGGRDAFGCGLGNADRHAAWKGPGY
jgi:hypothetical protein